MNVVSFYAPRKSHPLFQDYTPFLKLLDESCKKHGHKHIVITDSDELEGFTLFKTPLSYPLMKAILEGQLAYLKSTLSDEDTILVGADCVLANDPSEIFSQPFDVAFTTHPFNDCIQNTGAIFVRGRKSDNAKDVSHIWEEALAICGTNWGDDQLALAEITQPTLEHGLYDRDGVLIRFLPVDPYNLAPDHPSHDCSSAVILHFRGDRKNWMLDYCGKHLGIGPGVEITAMPNTDDAKVFENVRLNSKRHLKWLHELPANDKQAVICGSGPSLADDFMEIKRRQESGQVVFALNGAASFLMDHGIRADCQIIIDARPENTKFLKFKNAREYILASHCHPSLFDHLKNEKVTVLHSAMDGIRNHIPNERGATLIGGGITSGLTAIAACSTLGYRKIHLYGYDSSDREDKSHAFSQSENDAEKKRIEVWCEGRRFLCGIAMFKQAEAFEKFISLLDEGTLITVHGDGLLPYLAKQIQLKRQLAAA